MLHKFIFYGTCKNLDLLQKITSIKPMLIKWGFIKGQLFEIKDEFEPNKILRYPIAILNNKYRIKSLIVTYELERKEFKLLLKKLLIFEGGLYKYKTVEFIYFNGFKDKGIVFIAKNKKIIKNHPQISPLKPIKKNFSWK